MNAPDQVKITNNPDTGIKGNNRVIRIGGYKLSLDYLRRILLEIGTKPQAGVSRKGWYLYKGLVASGDQIISELERRKSTAHIEKFGDDHREDYEAYAAQMELPAIDENYGIPEVPMLVEEIITFRSSLHDWNHFGVFSYGGDDMTVVLDYKDFPVLSDFYRDNIILLLVSPPIFPVDFPEDYIPGKAGLPSRFEYQQAMNFINNYLNPFLSSLSKDFSIDYLRALSLYLDRLNDYIRCNDTNIRNLVLFNVYSILANNVQLDDATRQKMLYLGRSFSSYNLATLAAQRGIRLVSEAGPDVPPQETISNKTPDPKFLNSLRRILSGVHSSHPRGV